MFTDKLHIGGYHGTSIGAARSIEREGFKAAGYGEVYFAPIDDIFFAQCHGQRQAAELGDQTYGIVQANFPGSKLELGLEGDQIVIRGEDIGKIAVVAVLEFDAHRSDITVARNRFVKPIE